MDTNFLSQLEGLAKALEAGNYNVAPSQLMQGPSLQVEDLSPVMYNTTFQQKHIKLQKGLKVEECKSLLAQFNRQLSYGIFGGSAQIEGAVGQEETSDYVRIVVPMCFYSHTRRVTLASTMVETVDGKKSDDRAASDAAMKIAADIEFDLFRGCGDFSNAGVFDGNPLAIADLPNIRGLESQIRQSDVQSQAKDLMFAEYGSDLSVVIAGGGTLSQNMIEDAAVRSAMNHGEADKLLVDPLVLSAYNKISQNKERIILAGSPQEATGSDLRKQWTSFATVNVEASRFLSGKRKTQPVRASSPGGPTFTESSAAGTGTPFLLNQVYQYFVSAVNEFGESAPSPVVSSTIAANGRNVTLTITPSASGTSRYFNVYRSAAGAVAARAYFIGRVVNSGAATTAFVDLGNKQPAFVTGYLIQDDTMTLKELASYSRLKLAVTDLSMPEAHFRFVTLAVHEPRKSVLIDNLIGSM